MAQAMVFVGDAGIPIAAASGVHIPLTNAEAVTFVTFEADGSTILTLNESIDGASEQALAVIDLVHKAPGIGGTWTEVTQTAASTFDLADDATNDSFSLTVFATELSDGFNCLEATVDGGICMAIVHGLNHRRKPGNLPSSVV